ncbi:MAG: hypothetical protein Q8Q73_14750 [Stagnimonas sp.]|nr:hypothetical protein [Stagnimonas sp.]
MANPDIGLMPCPTKGCDCVAKVRKAVSGQRLLYLHCPEHGPLFYRTAKGQEMILEQATLFGPEGPPEPAPVPPPAPRAGPDPEPAPTPPPVTKPAAKGWHNPLEF